MGIICSNVEKLSFLFNKERTHSIILSINQRLCGKAQSLITFLFFTIARLKPGYLNFA
jgi:hypothetical protein